MTIQLASYLRSHRKKCGLSQRELALILGTLSEGQVSKHERSVSIPPLLVALGYEVVFCASLATLFPGIYETVRLGVEERLSTLESELQQSTAKGQKAALIARKLEWLWERRNSEFIRPTDDE